MKGLEYFTGNSEKSGLLNTICKYLHEMKLYFQLTLNSYLGLFKPKLFNNYNTRLQ